MPEMTTRRRARTPSKKFGLPEKARTPGQKKKTGNYPMPDKAHARSAKARASKQLNAGRLTKNEKKRIDRKADRVLKSKQ
ncbi:MAG: hypothetical protein WAT66_09680 [Actinomycetota bacterium]